MIIHPAIIPTDFEDLESKLVMVRGLTRSVQIDVCDGRLTGSPSWPYIGGDIEFKEILAQERGLPMWEDFDFEIDLMVLNPAHDYEQWIDAGSSRIIFHYREQEAATLLGLMDKTKERGVEVGLALHIGDSLEVLEKYRSRIDAVQLMGIERIGFQGQPFDERVLKRVKDVKAKYPDLPVSVDGGVNEDTAQSLVNAGVDRLVIGSAIFGDVDVAEAVSYFESLS